MRLTLSRNGTHHAYHPLPRRFAIPTPEHPTSSARRTGLFARVAMLTKWEPESRTRSLQARSGSEKGADQTEDGEVGEVAEVSKESKQEEGDEGGVLRVQALSRTEERGVSEAEAEMVGGRCACAWRGMGVCM